MNYHKSATELKLRECGRNLQQMADALLKIEDYDAQKAHAEDAVRVMNVLLNKGQSPSQEDVRKYWERLYALTDWQLPMDVKPEKLDVAPPVFHEYEPPEYPAQDCRFKQYGRNVYLMVQQALAMPPGPERDDYILRIANIMKICLQHYPNGQSNDEVVFDHLFRMTRGAIRLTPDDVTLNPTLPPPNKQSGKPSKSKSRSKKTGGANKKNQSRSGGNQRSGGGPRNQGGANNNNNNKRNRKRGKR